MPVVQWPGYALECSNTAKFNRFFFLLQNALTHSGSQEASNSIGTGIVSPEVKRPGCEIDHLPPSSAETKNEWRYISRYSS